jgi:hypothetical protein
MLFNLLPTWFIQIQGCKSQLVLPKRIEIKIPALKDQSPCREQLEVQAGSHDVNFSKWFLETFF